MKIKSGKESEYAAYKERNSHDGYSKAIVTWGEDLTRILESKLEEGKELESCIADAVRQSDNGYTGFMYDCMISAVTEFWEHGSTILRWHNRKYKPAEEADELSKEGKQVLTTVFSINLP